MGNQKPGLVPGFFVTRLIAVKAAAPSAIFGNLVQQSRFPVAGRVLSACRAPKQPGR